MSPTFTTDWFSRHIPTWQSILKPFQGQAGVRALEIGSWEGRSATWLLENVLTDPTSSITCVDTWDSAEYTKEQQEGVLERFASNMKEWVGTPWLAIVRGLSHVALRQLPLEETFDIIYIDGAHTAHNAFEDAVLSWRLLKVGGIMIFDDWLGGPQGNLSQLHASPHLGINQFCAIYGASCRVLAAGYQLAVCKAAEL